MARKKDALIYRGFGGEYDIPLKNALNIDERRVNCRFFGGYDKRNVKCLFCDKWFECMIRRRKMEVALRNLPRSPKPIERASQLLFWLFPKPPYSRAWDGD